MLFLLSRSGQDAAIDDFWEKNTKLMIFTKALFVYLSRAKSFYHSRACVERNTCWFVT